MNYIFELVTLFNLMIDVAIIEMLFSRPFTVDLVVAKHTTYWIADVSDLRHHNCHMNCFKPTSLFMLFITFANI